MHSERALFLFWDKYITEILDNPVRFYRDKGFDKFELKLRIHSTLDACIECDTFLSAIVYEL